MGCGVTFILFGFLYLLECMDRGYVSLISHPYGDSSAPYLGTAILTILCFLQSRRTIIILSTNRSYVISPCVTNSTYAKNGPISNRSAFVNGQTGYDSEDHFDAQIRISRPTSLAPSTMLKRPATNSTRGFKILWQSVDGPRTLRRQY